jgi:hypothetical protein
MLTQPVIGGPTGAPRGRVAGTPRDGGSVDAVPPAGGSENPPAALERCAEPVGVVAGLGPVAEVFYGLFLLALAFGLAEERNGSVPWWFFAALVALAVFAFGLVLLTPVSIACAMDAVIRWWSAPTYGERERWRGRSILGVLSTIPAIGFSVTRIVVLVNVSSRWSP